MTPSGWHDDTRSRDAGHDEMQAAVYRKLLGDEGSITRQARYSSKVTTYFQRGVEVEKAIAVRREHGAVGALLGFVDVAVWFEDVQSDEDVAWRKDRGISQSWTPTRWFVFLELKPKITSVGGLIRQCKAIRHMVRQASYSDSDVIPVVYADDPKAALLRELAPETMLWDRAA